MDARSGSGTGELSAAPVVSSVEEPHGHSSGDTDDQRWRSRRLSQVYRQHFEFVWRQLVRLGLDSASAEDAAQEVFLVFHRRAHELSNVRSPRAWLYGTCRRVASRSRRNRARRARTCGEYLDCLQASRSTRNDMPAHDLGLGLATAIAGLDDDKRDVFVLGQLEGMTGRELAECLEINPNTAASRLRAARAAVAQAMDAPCHRGEGERGLGRAALRRQAAARKRVWAALLPIPGVAEASAMGLASSASLGGVTTVLSTAMGTTSGVITTSLAFVAVSTVIWSGGLKANPEPKGNVQYSDKSAIETSTPRLSVTTRSNDEPPPHGAAQPIAMPRPPAPTGNRDEPPQPGVSQPTATTLPKPPAARKVPPPTRRAKQHTGRRRVTTRPPRASARPRVRTQTRPAAAVPPTPTLQTGELRLMKRIRAATLAGDASTVDRLSRRYLARFPGGFFASEVQRTRRGRSETAGDE